MRKRESEKDRESAFPVKNMKLIIFPLKPRTDNNNFSWGVFSSTYVFRMKKTPPQNSSEDWISQTNFALEISVHKQIQDLKWSENSAESVTSE